MQRSLELPAHRIAEVDLSQYLSADADEKRTFAALAASGRPVGVLVVLLLDDEVVIDHVYVAPTHRRQGVASQLRLSAEATCGLPLAHDNTLSPAGELYVTGAGIPLEADDPPLRRAAAQDAEISGARLLAAVASR